VNIKKIVIGGAAAATLGIAALAGAGTAFAAGNPPVASSAVSSTVPQADQSGPGTATSAEKAGVETGVSDGPGGHADTAGSNVDHQFVGNE